MRVFNQVAEMPESLQYWHLEPDWQELSKTRIDHELDVFDARRDILKLATKANFERDQAYYLVIAMTELGNNIVFHSLGGSLVLNARFAFHAFNCKRRLVALQIVAQDNGPGIQDTNQALQEGYSSINSMGCGLSGAKRLMNEFSLDSSPAGTTVKAVMWQNPEWTVLND